jgi:hypothetical protein
MFTIDALLVAVELALIVGFAVMVSRLEIVTSSSSPLGEPFSAAPLPDRPQGVQEEDLPPFVFRAPAPSFNPA